MLLHVTKMAEMHERKNPFSFYKLKDQINTTAYNLQS